MLVQVGQPVALGGDHPRLAFGEGDRPEGSWSGRRLMLLDGKPAFELSFPCGTCQFLFRRMEGSNESVSVEALQDRRVAGLAELDADVVTAFGWLLERGSYIPMLLDIEPRQVLPGSGGDYFSEEQVATWGVESFWGLPVYPSTAYYRTFEAPVSREAHLYEFVVPMVPPTWAEPARLQDYEQRFAAGQSSTAVAVSTLDVCAPAVGTLGGDWHEHWGLTHFLLDGHHKFQAAARTGRPLRLLSLLAVDASLATSEQVERVLDTRRQPQKSRMGRPT
jgi:hypothetical protein